MRFAVLAMLVLAVGCKRTPKATSGDAAAPPLTEASVQAIAERACRRGLRSAHADLNADAGLRVVEVECKASELSDRAIVTSAAGSFVAIAREVFRDPRVDVVDFSATAEFKDQYGKSREDEAVGLTMPRAVADKIDWSGFEAKNLDRVLSADAPKHVGGYNEYVRIQESLTPAWRAFSRSSGPP